jgi:GntR family transcriptional repressor for pyruvate dehydrogenase complex
MFESTSTKSISSLQRLLDFFEAQEFNAGDRLPSERDLAKLLGISRPSLREATQSLQARGYLDIKHGVGVFILNRDPNTFFNSTYQQEKHNLVELFEMREILEAPAVEWAAERHSSKDLISILDAFELLEVALAKPIIDFKEVQKLDLDFHLTIVRSAKNQFLNQTLGTLQEIMQKSMDTTLKLPGRIEKSTHEHGLIMEAIKRREPMTARFVIIQHIHAARDAWSQHLSDREVE